VLIRAGGADSAARTGVRQHQARFRVHGAPRGRGLDTTVRAAHVRSICSEASRHGPGKSARCASRGKSARPSPTGPVLSPGEEAHPRQGLPPRPGPLCEVVELHQPVSRQWHDHRGDCSARSRTGTSTRANGASPHAWASEASRKWRRYSVEGAVPERRGAKGRASAGHAGDDIEGPMLPFVPLTAHGQET